MRQEIASSCEVSTVARAMRAESGRVLSVRESIARARVTVAASAYGNLARVAMGFYVSTGNAGELDAAYVYARYAARAAEKAVR